MLVNNIEQPSVYDIDQIIISCDSFKIIKYATYVPNIANLSIPENMNVLMEIIGFIKDNIRSLLVCLILNSYGHVRAVSSPNQTLSWANLTKKLMITLCTYFCL